MAGGGLREAGGGLRAAGVMAGGDCRISPRCDFAVARHGDIPPIPRRYHAGEEDSPGYLAAVRPWHRSAG